MPFREKIAWLTLISMAIAYGVYFTILGTHLAAGLPHLLQIVWWFGSVTAVQLVVVIVGSIALAITARRDARTRADERDKAVARRGATIAYYVLMVEMILVGVVMPFTEPAWKIINAALIALVAAEAVRLITVILSYRRGWHG